MLSIVWLSIVFACNSSIFMFSLPFLIRAGVKSNVVDSYNITTGKWSTAQLSVARRNLAATTVRNMALFAGGYGPQGMLCALFRAALMHGLIVYQICKRCMCTMMNVIF
jgi:hypothetical protein